MRTGGDTVWELYGVLWTSGKFPEKDELPELAGARQEHAGARLEL